MTIATAVAPLWRLPITRGLDGIRRVLVIASGHTWSTLDAYNGLVEGCRLAGLETVRYDLHERLDGAAEWLQFARDRWGKPDDPPFSQDDITYQAGIRSVVVALEHNVDAVIVVTGMLFDPRLYILFQRIGMPVFLYGTESPYNDDVMEWAGPLATAVSVNERTSVDPVRAMIAKARGNTHVTYLPLGYNPRLHKRWDIVPDHIAAHDVVFVGTMYPGRARLLEAVDWTGRNLGLYGSFRALTYQSPLWQHKRADVVPNVHAVALYHRAKIVLNLFRSEQFDDDWNVIGEHVSGESIGPRMIEAAACGAFMISEYRPEVAEVFGDNVPTFRTPAEAEALIAYYLDNPSERERLAARLPACVDGWSYTDRARSIVGALEEAIAQGA